MSTLAALIPVMIGIGARAKQVTAQGPQSAEVREVVTVKIRCSYCGTLYDETLDRCPNCGAKR
jgi:rRNA maturation endonuclease Nob1